MRKLLIAEDDFFIRDVYSKTFIQSGYDVKVAVDGLDALEKVKNETFDIILLDIMMPKMTGLNVLIAIRSLPSPANTTAVFMITNLDEQNVIEEAFKKGMDGYIMKSQMNPQEVVKEIDTFFETKSQTNGR